MDLKVLSDSWKIFPGWIISEKMRILTKDIEWFIRISRDKTKIRCRISFHLTKMEKKSSRLIDQKWVNVDRILLVWVNWKLLKYLYWCFLFLWFKVSNIAKLIVRYPNGPETPKIGDLNDDSLIKRLENYFNSNDIPRPLFEQSFQDIWDSKHVRMPCSLSNQNVWSFLNFELKKIQLIL